MDYTQPTPAEAGYHQRAYTTRTMTENATGVWANVVRVGGARALFNPDDVWAMEMETMNKCVQLALNRRLVSTVKGLVIRDILPDIDFRDQSGNIVNKREWRQPWSGSYTASGSVNVYQTNANVGYHLKVFGFFGARLTDSGPGRTGTTLNATSIIFRDVANPRDIITLEGIDGTQESLVLFKQPIVYQDSQTMKIDMWTKSTASGTFDSIQFLGCVVEQNGNNIIG